MTSIPPNIYIIGAQSTGKTTLVNALAASADHLPPSTRPSIISEVARAVLAKHDFRAHDIRASHQRCSALQMLILKAQHDQEQEALRTNSWFISDRSGLDPLVYAERHVSPAFARTMMRTPEWQSLRSSLARSLIVVCEPVRGWLVDDGVRLMPADDEDWRDYHRRFCSCLDALGLEYRLLPSIKPHLEWRVRHVWEAWRVRAAQTDDGHAPETCRSHEFPPGPR
ncbi:hypothetical protein E4U42_002961 [Claviceps africana]|uniref:NadR/Ttd14 AAA domain-containing protein n=1 Tax=Claviceps africana TaxID=83212 RepID=A0A8K0JA88_9HYPO|nr:hypothetical protein E4U42_002961 [Claviceps africana]